MMKKGDIAYVTSGTSSFYEKVKIVQISPPKKKFIIRFLEKHVVMAVEENDLFSSIEECLDYQMKILKNNLEEMEKIMNEFKKASKGDAKC